MDKQFEEHVSKLFTKFDSKTDKQLHAAVGAATEAGELLDQMKKVWVYGKTLDRENVLEECGDIFFYATAMLLECDMTMQEAFEYNIKKLRDRYPQGKFTEQDAIERKDKVIEVTTYPLPKEIQELFTQRKDY